MSENGAQSSGPDDELMRRIGGGSHDALAALIQRHQERIWTLAYHFSGRCHDADDVTQEAILRIWRSAGRYGANGRFETK